MNTVNDPNNESEEAGRSKVEPTSPRRPYRKPELEPQGQIQPSLLGSVPDPP